VELIWPKPATKVFVYDIERRARGETQWTKCLGAGGDETTYSDLTAAADTAYEYRVTARDMFGQSAQSTATVVTPPAQNFEERLLDGSSS